jgi:hypothetical protein
MRRSHSLKRRQSELHSSGRVLPSPFSVSREERMRRLPAASGGKRHQRVDTEHTQSLEPNVAVRIEYLV